MPLIARDQPVIDITPAREPLAPVSGVLDKSTLTQDVQRWSAEATGLTIRDAAGCTQASYLLRSIKGLRSDIQRWFAPHVDAATETKRKAEAARKALTDEQGRMEAPLVDAEGRIKRALLAYEQEQERARRAEEQRLQAEAQRQAEADTLAAAAALEMEAATVGDAEMRAEAEAILAQPVEAPAVVVRSSVPKVQGVVYRDNWTVHPEIDVRALAAAVASGAAPASFLTPNLVALRAWAKATQGGQTLPGVRAVNDRQIAARG
jgi:hypothetical protein